MHVVGKETKQNVGMGRLHLIILCDFMDWLVVGSIESFKLMLMEELKERSTKGCVGEWRIEWTSPFSNRGE